MSKIAVFLVVAAMVYHVDAAPAPNVNMFGFSDGSPFSFLGFDPTNMLNADKVKNMKGEPGTNFAGSFITSRQVTEKDSNGKPVQKTLMDFVVNDQGKVYEKHVTI